MWALPFWGFWCFFPLVGMLICLGFLVMFRSGSAGHGRMGSRRSTNDQVS